MAYEDRPIWPTWPDVQLLVQDKRVIFFGRGEWFKKTTNYLPDGHYIVDNSKYEQGQEEGGLKIYNPEKLLTEDRDKIFIIITTTGFREVQAQLCKLGFIPGRHFCVSPSLKNFRVISRINEHKQTIYLTCSDQQGGGLFSFNIQSRELKKIISGVCHGIVEGKDCIYLVDDTRGICTLTKDFELQEEFKLPPKSRPHGIAYYPQRDWVFVNFSGRDSFGIYESSKQLFEVFISDKWATLNTPQHHVNDLCVFNNSLYISMFSFSGNWKLGVFDGGILEFDISSYKMRGPVVNNLWMPHSPKVIDGTLFYCDSMRGKVYSGTSRLLTEFNGFVRGIAYDGKFYYIGQSMHRYIDRRRGTTNNISLDTGIFMVDSIDKATKFFAIPQLTDIDTVFVI